MLWFIRNGLAVLLIAVPGILPCLAGDDKFVSVPDDFPPRFDPAITKARVKSSTVNFTAKVSDNRGVENVILFYRSFGAQSFDSTNMRNIGTDLFVTEIPMDDVSAPGVEYYIVATDINNNKSLLGQPEKPFMVQVSKAEEPNRAPTPIEAQKDGMNVPKARKTLVEALEDKPARSKMPAWIWIAVGTVVAGGAAAAINNNNDRGNTGRGEEEATVIISAPLP